MSAAALIQQAKAAGVTLRLVDGKVKITGTKAAVAGLIEPLRQHKADLVRWFEQAAVPVEVLQEEYRLYSRLAPSTQPEPQPEPEPPADPEDWRELAAAYNAHHVNCKHCQAAGRGTRYGLRCGVGASLWSAYSEKA
ncbi:MAG: hypothetical protein Q7T21_15635 [Gallionella sp.]|nr:hypothetical protein [Gallionella sp.]